MRKLDLHRLETGIDGTFGVLIFGEQILWIAEPPDRQNFIGKSCINAGQYICQWQRSPKYGWCYEVARVPDRTRILIHAGNLAGDTDCGRHTHTRGCLLPGLKIGEITSRGRRQRAVLNSRAALRLLEKRMNRRPFKINIHPINETN